MDLWRADTYEREIDFTVEEIQRELIDRLSDIAGTNKL